MESTYAPSKWFGIFLLIQIPLHLLSYVVLFLARGEEIDCEKKKTAILRSERVENTWNMNMNIIEKSTWRFWRQSVLYQRNKIVPFSFKRLNGFGDLTAVIGGTWLLSDVG